MSKGRLACFALTLLLRKGQKPEYTYLFRDQAVEKARANIREVRCTFDTIRSPSRDLLIQGQGLRN